ncbi:hypothetical protein [Actinoplanes subglobosus]|uniref:SnoaL-like domain-containing protein n=1 Tax=Actinoplanes subglobosus TaxID=1547892 RepID=A0ABV8J621_9ACTN
MYALYAWGNFFSYESGLDRDAGWLDPELLRGARATVSEHLTIADEGPLRVDGPGTLFEIGDSLVEGRDLAGRDLVGRDMVGRDLVGRDLVGRDLSGVDWRVARIRVATDGSRADALRITSEIEEAGDIYVDHSPEGNPIGFGEVVTTWEDEHGQWDLALIRL